MGSGIFIFENLKNAITLRFRVQEIFQADQDVLLRIEISYDVIWYSSTIKAQLFLIHLNIEIFRQIKADQLKHSREDNMMVDDRCKMDAKFS